MNAIVPENLTRFVAAYHQARMEPGSLTPSMESTEVEYVELVRDAAKINQLVPNLTFDWYEALLEHGPGQKDPLFPYLANQATMEQMIWFLQQEAAGEAGFGDLVALAQVKMPNRVKLEMARNYWDEMGRGEERHMHHLLLETLLKHLQITPTINQTAMEPLMLNNVMTSLANLPRYAYQAIGALGVIEMTAPSRVGFVDMGLERLGVSQDARRYFTLHATLDIRHSREWNREVIQPLADTHMQQMAEGAYLRLWCGEQCFRRYRTHMWGDPTRAPSCSVQVADGVKVG